MKRQWTGNRLKVAAVLLLCVSMILGMSALTQACDDNGQPAHTRLVMLKTAGGPAFWPDATKRQGGGVSTALAVGDNVYIVDAGENAAVQYARAHLGTVMGYENLRAIFLTHLHDDHTVDLPSFFIEGLQNGIAAIPPARLPIPVIGPATGNPAPPLPPFFGNSYIDPANPFPGTAEVVDSVITAYRAAWNAHAMNIPRFPDPRMVFDGRDITLPAEIGASRMNRFPAMDPFEIYQDENVRVTAVLVNHIWPAFAYRFDTADGSVVFSGDTGADTNGNLVRLAQGADILVHEVFHPVFFARLFGPPPFPPEVQPRIDAFYREHTSIETVGRIAEEAGVSKLVLNHLIPADLPADEFISAIPTGAFSGKVIVSKDMKVICVD